MWCKELTVTDLKSEKFKITQDPEERFKGEGKTYGETRRLGFYRRHFPCRSEIQGEVVKFEKDSEVTVTRFWLQSKDSVTACITVTGRVLN